jgi:hypothetical protein
MEILVWQHWMWFRPLFILLLVAAFGVLVAVIDGFRKQRGRRTRRARMKRFKGDAGREIRIVARDSPDAVRSRWTGPTSAVGSPSKAQPRRVAG